MNPYLQRLKKNTDIPEVSPTKPTEPSFDGFVGSTMGSTVNFFLDSRVAASEGESPDTTSVKGAAANEDGLNAQVNAFSRDNHADETEALMIARRAIAMAALTDEQKTKRLADLHRDPGLAAFWLACGQIGRASCRERVSVLV